MQGLTRVFMASLTQRRLVTADLRYGLTPARWYSITRSPKTAAHRLAVRATRLSCSTYRLTITLSIGKALGGSTCTAPVVAWRRVFKRTEL